MSIVRADKKIPAGILAILLGWTGIHKFFLGYPAAGKAMLAMYGVGWLLGLLHIPLLGWLLVSIVHVIAFIEGIIYLTRSDTDWYRQYVIGSRPWF